MKRRRKNKINIYITKKYRIYIFHSSYNIFMFIQKKMKKPETSVRKN